MKKGQSEFVWIFSLIIGAMILFLAIFSASKLFKTGTYLTETEIVRNFDIILNPFSSMGSIASLTLSKEIELPYEAEMNITCSGDAEKISLRTIEKGKKGDWTSPYTIKNKYIFSEKILQGKKFDTFSKPFKLPWRVDDMIYITSNNYCFLNTPTDIYKELMSVNASRIKPASNAQQCGTAIRVCFDDFAYCTRAHDINVSTSSKTVKKAGLVLFFLDDASMYAAILSDYDIYSCNMKRLMNRTANQAGIILSEANLISACTNANFRTSLGDLISEARNFASSGIGWSIINTAARVKGYDEYLCPLVN
jgi:hypothetical protein